MKRIAIIFISICLLILLNACGNSNSISKKDIVVNDNIIHTKGFDVSSDSSEMNTSAKGTVYIKGSEKIPEKVQIVVLIEIDPNDWGGVVFYVPDGWSVSGITSSYPENEIQTIPMDYVATWTTADMKSEWKTMIEVGRDRSYIPTGGGTGTVVIDLIPNKNVMQRPETFTTMVSVGSDERDGVKIVGTDSITVEIPLSSTR